MRFATSDEPTADVGRHWDQLICSDGKYTWLCDCSELMLDESIQVWVNLEFYKGAHLSHSWRLLGFQRKEQLYNQQSLNGSGYTIRKKSNGNQTIALTLQLESEFTPHGCFIHSTNNSYFTLFSNSVIFCYSSQSEAGVTKCCDWIVQRTSLEDNSAFLLASWIFF